MSNAVSQLHLTRWERIWFSDGSALTLTVARTLVFGCVAVDVVTEPRFRTITELGSTEWSPISALAVLNLGVPPAWVITLAISIALVASLSSMVGLAPRIGGIAVAVSYPFLVLAMNSFGKIYHDRNVLVILVWVYALAAAPRFADRPQPLFRWPLQLSRLVLGLMFLAAAWAKVRNGQGPDWVLGPNMRNILASEVLIYETPTLRGPALGDVAVWIAGTPLLWKGAAAFALVGEAALIGAVFVRTRWVRTTLVTLGLGTMVGITLLMGMVGFPVLVLALVFVDLDRIEPARSATGRGLAFLGASMPLAVFLAIGAVAVMHRANLLVALPIIFSVAIIGLFVLKTSSSPGTPGSVPGHRPELRGQQAETPRPAAERVV